MKAFNGYFNAAVRALPGGGRNAVHEMKRFPRTAGVSRLFGPSQPNREGSSLASVDQVADVMAEAMPLQEEFDLAERSARHLSYYHNIRVS